MAAMGAPDLSHEGCPCLQASHLSCGHPPPKLLAPWCTASPALPWPGPHPMGMVPAGLSHSCGAGQGQGALAMLLGMCHHLRHISLHR